MKIEYQSQVTSLVSKLAVGAELSPNYCANWTMDHYNIVRSHLLSPWLYASLKGYGSSGLPKEIFLLLENDFRTGAIAATFREALLTRLINEFNLRNIPLLVLKGAYLGQAVYHDPALRPMYDVDLMVQERDFRETREILESLGYKILVDPIDINQCEIQPSAAFTHSGPFMCDLDIHWAVVSMDYYRLPAATIWLNVTQGEMFGQKVFFFTPELNFIHVAIHTLNHRTCLRNWLDLMLLLRHTPLNPEKLVSLAVTLGVIRPLFWIFRELRANWDYDGCPEVDSSLAQYTPGWLEDRVICHTWHKSWRIFSRFFYLYTWRSRMYYLKHIVFPPPAYRMAVVGNTSWTDYMRSKVSFLLPKKR